jgi:membrane protease YdiL (CAAX protease family)
LIIRVKSWGRWATLGLGLTAMLVGQMAGLMAVVWWHGISLAQITNLASDGIVATLIICISTPVQVFLLVLMSTRRGSNAADYLGLTLPDGRDVVSGIISVVIFIALADGISWLLGRDIVTPFQLDLYRTASRVGWLPWLLLTVVVVAPIGEEILFRGFLFRGWHRSRRDLWLAIVVTALLWALVHLQYDYYYMGQVFVYGLVLGWFRWLASSTILTIFLHGLINLEGMLETFIAIHA